MLEELNVKKKKTPDMDPSSGKALSING